MFGRLRSNTNLLLLLLSLVVLIPIFSGWVGDITREFLNDWGWFKRTLAHLSISVDSVVFGIGLLGLIGLLTAILIKKKQLLGVQSIKRIDTVWPRRVVIALLSLCDNIEEPQVDEDPSNWKIKDNKEDRLVSLEGLTIDQLTDPEFKHPNGNKELPRWPWQQTLRAAWHHDRDGTLERLVLIGSLDEGGSGSGTKEQLVLAEKFFSHYFPGKINIPAIKKLGFIDKRWSAEFEDLDSLHKLLVKVLNEQREQGYFDENIIIDCTGGLKTTSIACALVTLDRPNLRFQYVGTNGLNGKIMGFNAVNASRLGA